MRRIISGSS
jgi:FixJ family two-component response regulator